VGSGRRLLSTEDQDLTIQRAALKAAGYLRLYEEKVSGAKRDLRKLARMLDAVRDRDVVVVTRLDRLARSTKDLLEVSEIVSGIDADLRSLGELWADTTSPAGRAMAPDCQASSARRP
jgi:DNA invertase Pin-like site-specific DNA recombinase